MVTEFKDGTIINTNFRSLIQEATSFKNNCSILYIPDIRV